MSNKTQFLDKPGGRIAYDDSGGSGRISRANEWRRAFRGRFRSLPSGR